MYFLVEAVRQMISEKTRKGKDLSSLDFITICICNYV